MEIWIPQDKSWVKLPFGVFPDKKKGLREAVLDHLDNRLHYPERYYVVFSLEEEKKLAEIGQRVMADRISLPSMAAEIFLWHLMDLVRRIDPAAPLVVYIPENPREAVMPPFRLALLFLQ